MCTWDDIHSYLARNLAEHLQEPASGHRWLGSLARSDEHKVLGICLAIDLSSGGLPKDLLVEVLNLLPAKYDNPRAAFAQAVARHPQPTRLLCASAHPAHPIAANDSYAQVTSLDGFTYAIGADLEQINPDRERVREMYIEGEQPLQNVYWRLAGRRGCAWVTRRSAIESFTEGVDRAQVATHLVAGLGLYMASGDDKEMVLVTYPPSFETHTRVHQPSTLDSRWDRNHYFLSYPREDGFGRTHPLLDGLPPCPERVHPNFEGVLDGLYTSSIGERRQLEHEITAYLHAALSRFCGGRHSPPPAGAV